MERTPLHKNQEVRLQVERFGMDAAGVCHLGGRVVFVPGALPGEEIVASITRVEKRHAFARLVRVEQASPDRVSPPCPLASRCGGCCAQHMCYEATLEYKRQQVADCLSRIGGLSLPVPAVLGAAHPWHYRNKASYPIAGTPESPHIGFYAPRSHRIVDLTVPCRIQRPGSDEALRTVWDWMQTHRVTPYDEQTHTGLLRHLVTRCTRAGEVMVILVANGNTLPAQETLLEALQQQVPMLRSVVLSVHRTPGNAILGTEMRTLWGASTLWEQQQGLSLRLSPLSFFQVHPEQAEVLYNLAMDWAELGPDTTLVDAYSGAGGIALSAARRAGQVVGLEIVPEAIQDAQANAQANGIENVRFVQGAVEETLPALLREGLAPDVLLLDPPRKGAAPEVLSAIAAARIPRLVYVSCNPATLARDAGALCQDGYRALAVQPVDMFCWTGAVECVMLLAWEGGARDGNP